jgi:hypothetical protein
MREIFMNVAKTTAEVEPKEKRSRLLLAEIGVRFRTAQRGRTDTEIERLSGVSNNVIKRCGNGEQAPNWPLIDYYCREEGFSADWFLFGDKGKDVETFEAWLAKAMELSLAQKLRLLTALAAAAQESFVGTQEGEGLGAEPKFFGAQDTN